jgi:ubiquitin-conjugating enzyme E2 M
MLLFSTTKSTPKNPKPARTSILAEKRLKSEIEELDPLPNILFIPSPDNDLFSFTITITAEEGYWKGGTYSFQFNYPPNYPYKPPKIKCVEKIYHPNIDSEGHVCVSVLREDYSPVFSLNHFIQSLLFILYTPNMMDPLEGHIAVLYQSDYDQFVRNVKASMRGRVVEGIAYTRAIP